MASLQHSHGSVSSILLIWSPRNQPQNPLSRLHLGQLSLSSDKMHPMYAVRLWMIAAKFDARCLASCHQTQFSKLNGSRQLQLKVLSSPCNRCAGCAASLTTKYTMTLTDDAMVG